MKKVAVIILNWNGAALLRRYLPSVLENTNEALADIIVADNGSNDESRDVLSHEFPQVKTLFFEQNYGFAEGYNRAIKETGHPITILLNSDVRTPAGWLEPLVEALLRHAAHEFDGLVPEVDAQVLHRDRPGVPVCC